jgi:hypothetical protein
MPDPFAEPNVNTPTAEYEALEKRRALPRALMGGTLAMREQATTYLPQWEGEKGGAPGKSGYQRRLHTATLEPFYQEAVKDLAGRVFSKPVTLSEDVPEAIRGSEVKTPADSESLWENIDNAGRDGHVFCRDVFEGAIAEGMECILVDHTPAPEPATPGAPVLVADAKAAGVRPYWVQVHAGAIIESLVALDGGTPVLQRARIREEAFVTDGQWAQKRVDRVRVLHRGNWRLAKEAAGYHARWELHEKIVGDNGKEDWVRIDAGEFRPLTEIPLVPIYTGRAAPWVAYPPLEDLAWNNCRHWQKQSHLDLNLFITAVNIFTGTGIDDEGVNRVEEAGIAPGAFWSTSQPDAEFGNIQWNADISKALQDDLDRLEESMKRQAREPLMPRTGDRTATAEAISEARTHSLLESWAIVLEDAIELALGYTAQYLGEDSGGSCSVNRRFGFVGNVPEMLKEVRELNKQGELSGETTREIFAGAGALPDTFDEKVERQRLDEDAALMPGADDDLRQRIEALEGRGGGAVEGAGELESGAE